MIIHDDGWYVTLQCTCGAQWIEDLSTATKPERELLKQLLDGARCPQCKGRENEAKNRLELEERRAKWAAAIPGLIDQSGIPLNYRLQKPPVPAVAAWLFHHWDRNLLLSGPTGSGKSTSACCVAMRQIAEHGVKVRYSTLRKLSETWRAAKTSQEPGETERFLARIGSLDVLIIDEMVGKMAITPTARELLFELIDGVYSLERKNRLWLLGEFQEGALSQIFGRAESVMRRLRERFDCAYIAPDGSIQPIKFNEVKND